MTSRARLGFVLMFFTTLAGCGVSGTGSGYSALSSGSQAPAIQASGWTNGGPPEDLDGNVVVLEMFATW